MNNWQARAWFLLAMSSTQSSDVSSKSVTSRSRSFKAVTSSWLSSSGISFLFRLTSVIWWRDFFRTYWILRSQHYVLQQHFERCFWLIVHTTAVATDFHVLCQSAFLAKLKNKPLVSLLIEYTGVVSSIQL